MKFTVNEEISVMDLGAPEEDFLGGTSMSPREIQLENFNGEYPKFQALNEALSRNIFLNDVEVEYINGHKQPDKMTEIKKRLQSTKSDKYITIISWLFRTGASDMSTSEQQEFASQYGIDAGAFYSPEISELSRDELPIYVGHLLVAIYDKKLHVLWTLFDTTHTASGLNMLYYILRQVAKKLTDGDTIFKKIADDDDDTLNLTICNTATFKKQQIKDTQKRLEKAREEIISYGDRLASAVNTENSALKMLSTLDGIEDSPITIANKYIKHIDESDDKITFYTDNIYITDFDSKKMAKYYDALSQPNVVKELKANNVKFYLGQMKIEMSLNDYSLNITNINNEKSVSESYGRYHPHVNSSGRPCVGNLADFISHARGTGDFQALIDVIIQYLQSVNIEDSAGKTIKYRTPITLDKNINLSTNKAFNEPTFVTPNRRIRISKIVKDN